MKKAIFALALVFALASVAEAKGGYKVYGGSVRSTKGHLKDTNGDGMKDAYIRPYKSKAPNSTKIDNYSSRPNTNPYTGKEGTVDPFK